VIDKGFLRVLRVLLRLLMHLIKCAPQTMASCVFHECGADPRYSVSSTCVTLTSHTPTPHSRTASRMNVEMKDSGKVKFFDTTKGFGFITPSKGGEDIFVHQTAVYAQGFRSLAEGEDVEFDVSEDKAKGRKFATNVTGPNGAYVQGSPRRERAPMGNGGGYDRY